ncbi:MAG TPA: LacI family DNA-binding transcriptional regulator [Anaerolineales bacterium]|nr:LacI family DNA-binding transcriptional regulator [Anaerolineales bacterium]
MTSRKKNPTIYDVAKLSGVSIATISRVLNASNKVNPETQRRVMSAIDQLGFVPKAEARARALKSIGRIGVLTPFFTAPSFVQRLRGVASALSKANYELVIYPVDTMEQLQGYISSIPLRQNLVGLIIMSLAITDDEAHRLHKSNMDTVLIEYTHPHMNSLVIDDVQGGTLVAEHLLQKGHERVAFLGDIEPPERYAIHPVKSRLDGFRQGLKKVGISLPRTYVRSCPYLPEETRRAAYELLSMTKPPTAIFAASDMQALSIMKVARQLKRKIPDDIAIVGFDDIDVAEHVDLTTVRQHLDESGRLAAEMLLARAKEPNRPLQHIALPLELVERLTS